MDPDIGDTLYTLLLGLPGVAVADGVRLAPGKICVAVGVGVDVPVEVAIMLAVTDGVDVAGIAWVAVGGMGVPVGPLPATLKFHHWPPLANKASLGFTATTSQ